MEIRPRGNGWNHPPRPIKRAPTQHLNDPKRCLKVVVVGDAFVGKTNILERLSNHRFDPARRATERYDTAELWVEMGGQITRLEIWDTAGQEEHRSLASQFYRGAHLCLFVYDLTNRKSFEGVRWWYNTLLTESPPAMTLLNNNQANAILIGNKLDLTHLREVSHSDGEQIAKEWGIPFVEQTSVDSHQASELECLFGSVVRKTLQQLVTHPYQRPRNLTASVIPDKPADPLQHQMPLPKPLDLSLEEEDPEEREAREERMQNALSHGVDDGDPVLALLNAPSQRPTGAFSLQDRRVNRVIYYELDGQTYVDETPEDACAC